jgi:heptaprenylglyceryl phosphate synthase
MNHQLNAGSPGIFDTGISLQLLVNRLVGSSQGMAFHNKITVVNEVPRDIHVVADNSKVVPIIDELLTTVVANARNSQIYISADRYKDIIILNIQDRNNYNGYALAFSIMSIESQVNETGGSLTIDGKQKKIATVSFSFPNYGVAS